MLVELSDEEIDIIMDDSIALLESCHRHPLHECGEMCDCPLDHFDSEVEEEIIRRQAFIKKLDQI